jgi:hypothetical protein
MVAAIVAEWWDDRLALRDTVMIARDNNTVAELAGAARAVRVAAGDVEAAGVQLRDGTRARVGDRIVTRDNSCRMRTETDREVVNWAVWRVTERHSNGALAVVSEPGDRVFLPPGYVSKHVELAYGATIAGVEGRTLDGARALFDERSARDELCLAMTRGRHFNVGYRFLRRRLRDRRPPSGCVGGGAVRWGRRQRCPRGLCDGRRGRWARVRRQHRAPRRHPRRLDARACRPSPRRVAPRRRRHRAGPRR